MNINVPNNVKRIISTLEAAGYEAYAVGGCVRDSILGREPDDWDITTSAKPLEVKKLFKKTFDTGIQHGTITVLMDRVGYEVTTYRIDGEYEDSRHPKEVIFTPNLIEDLKRRDFTINAMAYNERSGLVDCFHGIDDIDQKMIRCVGDATERFTEDALRIMRAVRFSAQLDYQIAPETKSAIHKLCDTLQKISAERIRVELTKLLVSDHPDKILDLKDYGILKVILPSLQVTNLTAHILRTSKPDKISRFTVLLQEKSEAEAAQILRDLHFDNDTVRKVSKLVGFYHQELKADKVIIRQQIRFLGDDLFPLFLELREADIQGRQVSDLLQDEEYCREEITLAKVATMYQEILEAGDCTSMKQLAISGKDLISIGMEPGRELGDALEESLNDVISFPEHNTKDYLLNLWIHKKTNN